MSFKLKTPSLAKLAKEAQKPKNPLDDMMEYTGNEEVDAKRELEIVAKGSTAFGEAISAQRKAIADNNDTVYYSTICGATREQMEEFFGKIGMEPSQIIWLEDLAEALGLELEKSNFSPKPPKHDKKLFELTE